MEAPAVGDVGGGPQIMDSVDGMHKIEAMVCLWNLDKKGRLKKDKEVRFCPSGKFSTAMCGKIKKQL